MFSVIFITERLQKWRRITIKECVERMRIFLDHVLFSQGAYQLHGLIRVFAVHLAKSMQVDFLQAFFINKRW